MSKTILFDIDGLLARFTDGACRLHGWPVEQPTDWNFHHARGVSDVDFYANMGRDFWAGLDLWHDGMELLMRAEDMGVRIRLLTSPVQTAGCVDGKRDWVRKYLPTYADRMIPYSEKELFASLGGRDVILVDDSDTNVHKFNKAGGHVLLTPRPWNARASECDEKGLFHVGQMQDELRGLLK